MQPQTLTLQIASPWEPHNEQGYPRAFDRWEQVWHEGRYDLVETCVADSYLRHDEKGDRIVTPASYRAEIVDYRTKLPDILPGVLRQFGFNYIAPEHANRCCRAYSSRSIAVE